MQHRFIATLLTAAAALLAGNAVLAADPAKAAAPTPAAGLAKPTPQPAAPKPVDINSASRAELKALPGIGDAEAERIIKARPYLSKANLVSGNVLSLELYQDLKGRIVAVQKAPPSKSKR